MKIIDKYLLQMYMEYAHPLQTRPKPTGGIIKQSSNDKKYSLNIRGPSGMEVDLDQDEKNDFNKPFIYKYKLGE